MGAWTEREMYRAMVLTLFPLQHCCRNVLCSKFTEPQDCAWISSGDDTWKRDLSNDLDRVEYIEKRLQELSNSDFGDPDGDTEKAQLTVRLVPCLPLPPNGRMDRQSKCECANRREADGCFLLNACAEGAGAD